MNEIELEGFKKVIKTLVANNKRKEAFELLDFFFKQMKSLVELDVIGQLSLDTEYRDLYLRCAERAYAVSFGTQQKYSARTNLIKAYNTMNWPEKAMFHIEQQLMLNPDNYEVLCEKSANLALQGNKDEAEALIFSLMDKHPDKKSKLEPMLAGKYLREGQLTKGVICFVEGYKKDNELFETRLNMKRWDGLSYPGKILYVDGEGGIGDELINIRFFENVRSLGMRPILISHDNEFFKDKNNLFRRMGIEILSESFSIDKTQYWTPMMSLPADLKLSESDLWKGPYIKPLRQEKNQLSGDKFKIGIKCSGNPYFAQDEYRKIPLELMLSYLPKDVDIYYIDKTKGHPGTIELADRIDSWEDTLDFIDQMDCIVSSCTSLVHAAGAIGKTTFVAVPIAEYYIWTSSRRDNSTPWYGNHMNVFKQTKVRDWNEPLSSIAERVGELINNWKK